MKFQRYIRGSVVASAFDANGAICLRRADGLGFLRTSDGIPRSVIEPTEVADVAVILACVAENLDREGCASRGVEVVA